jgi:hypothetical protein
MVDVSVCRLVSDAELLAELLADKVNGSSTSVVFDPEGECDIEGGEVSETAGESVRSLVYDGLIAGLILEHDDSD